MKSKNDFEIHKDTYNGYNIDSGFMGKVFYKDTNIAFYKLFASEADYKELFDDLDKDDT